jgi:diguanylate cyclase (GGDEF)-like protein
MLVFTMRLSPIPLERLSPNVSLVFVIAVALFLVALGFLPSGIYFALPLSALAMTVVASLGWFKVARSWRWATLGGSFWFLEELLWAYFRSTNTPAPIWLTDTVYFMGAACWLIALHLMPTRILSKRSVIAGLPIVLFLAWLLTQSFRTLSLGFPLTEVLLFLYAIPMLEAAYQGRASEGRIVWVFGFFVRALASALYAWLEPSMTGLVQPFLILSLLSYTFIFLGLWLEQAGNERPMLAVVYGIVALELVVGLTVYMVYESYGPTYVLLFTVLMLAYILTYSVIVLIATDRNRRLLAERELKNYTGLLERLVSFRSDKLVTNLTTSGALRTFFFELFKSLQATFPTLLGMQVRAGELVTLGNTQGHTFRLEHESKHLGTLYFREAPSNERVLQTLLPLLAAHIQTTFAHVHSQTQAMTDPLTGLYNRRGLEVQAALLFGQAHEHGEAVSLAVLDLDFFKRVNDTYGHDIGDLTLQHFTDILRQNLRHKDLLVRWGGEEFVLVLYGSDLRASKEVLKRISVSLRITPLPPVQWELTFSAGLAGGDVPASQSPFEFWMAEADKALFRAKEAGRDRIEVAA